MAMKVGELYGLSIDEAMKLTPDQVSFMEAQAKSVAEDMFTTSPELQKALQDRLTPVTRQIRSQIQSPGPPPAGGSSVGPPPTRSEGGAPVRWE